MKDKSGYDEYRELKIRVIILLLNMKETLFKIYYNICYIHISGKNQFLKPLQRMWRNQTGHCTKKPKN